MAVFKRKREAAPMPTISREHLLKSRPLRNPFLEWVKDEKTGLVSITIPLEEKKSIFFPTPKSKVIQLDAIGSYLWPICDGSRTLNDIIKILCNKYKISPREAEVSFTAFLRVLMRRRLIGLLPPTVA